MNGEGLKLDGDIGEGISGAISKLMEHPELISMVASALEKSSPEENPSKVADSPKDTEAITSDSPQLQHTDVLTSLIPMLSKMTAPTKEGNGSHGSNIPHAQLLCALKPYVSESRRSAIDYVLKISQMSALIGVIK